MRLAALFAFWSGSSLDPVAPLLSFNDSMNANRSIRLRSRTHLARNRNHSYNWPSADPIQMEPHL